MPFAQINQLLQKYAELPINEEGNARDQAAEQKVLEELHDALGPVVRQAINQRWPPISPADRKDDVEHEFWALFLNHIRRKRAEDHEAVQVKSRSYVDWWVRYANGSRGLPPLARLSAAIDRYLDPHSTPDEQDKHRTCLLAALKHCCDTLMDSADAQRQVLIRTLEEVASDLFEQIARQNLWNNRITPIYAQRAEDLDSNEEDGGFQPVWNVPRYVTDWAAFRAEAWPLLFGGSPPSPPSGTTTLSADQLVPEKCRDTMKDLINKKLGNLNPAKPQATFRCLCCLLFLGYYEKECTFVAQFGIPNTDRYKGVWAELIGQYLASIAKDARNAPQEKIVALYKNHKYYGRTLDCLHSYRFVACADDARQKLWVSVETMSSVVLLSLAKHCFELQDDVLNASPSPEFLFQNDDGDTPADLVSYKEPDEAGIWAPGLLVQTSPVAPTLSM